MAIGPQDLQTLTPEDEANVKKIEDAIDAKLQANYDIGGQARLNITSIANMLKCRLTFKMRKELVIRYEKVGWVVACESDATSEYFIFSEPVAKSAEEVEDAMIPDMSTNDMLNKMSEAGSAPRPSGPVSPFKGVAPDIRGVNDPYSRKKLNSKP